MRSAQQCHVGALRSELLLVQQSGLTNQSLSELFSLSATKREVLLLSQDATHVAARMIPAVVKHRTLEDKLWFALANLSAGNRVQVSVAHVTLAERQNDQAQMCEVTFIVALLPDFFTNPKEMATATQNSKAVAFDEDAQALLYHLINHGMPLPCPADRGQQRSAVHAGDELDASMGQAMLVGEEAHEEVAYTVQQQRRERLRDDVLNMVCPSDWTVQAPEPAGLKLPLHAYQRHALAWMCWRECIGTRPDPGSPCATPGLMQSRPSQAASSFDDSVAAEAEAAFGVSRDRGGQVLHPCWQPVTLPSGLQVFENRYSGSVTLDPPPAPPPLHGGILGDEMGLGKTAEMHALMCARSRPSHATKALSVPAANLLHPACKDTDNYTSGKDHSLNHGSSGPDDPDAELCHSGSLASAGTKRKRAESDILDDKSNHISGACSGPSSTAGISGPVRALVPGHNLVVCPTQLKDQWINEVAEKHGSLKVVVYEGLKWHHRQAEEDKKTTRKMPSNKNKAARMAWMQDQWEKLAQVSSGDVQPSFDPQQEAADALQLLLDADVVLTSYDVLRQEVHYSPEGAKTHSLRHAKKYSVPESPLLSVSWWRVVLDEAQMVGTGMSNVAAMAGRLHSQHRWAVTGTPIGPGGLDDIQGLLRVLQHDPLADPLVWKWCISEPYLTGEKGSAARLAQVLRPIMWRNSKRSTADLGLELPPRTLTLTRLHFTSAEHTFYSHILEKTREARDALHHYQRPLTTGTDIDAAGPSVQSPSHADRQRGAAAAQVRKLFEGAEREVRQLRLACIHPQMTAYWQNLSAELQLDSGGALSMGQIMQRLLDGVQLELQAQERDLCAHLNTLASLKVTAVKDSQQQGQSPAKGLLSPDADEEGASASNIKKRKSDAGPSTPKKKRRQSSSSADLVLDEEGRAQKLSEALHLLQRSQAVGESGIEALHAEGEVQELDNTIIGADATIKAWRFMQANTAHQLAEVYDLLDNSQQAGAMRVELQAKVKDVREAADDNLAKAAARVAQARSKVEELKGSLLEHWQEADRQGWQSAMLGCHEWVQGLVTTFAQAQDSEKQAREEHTFSATGDSQQTLMGTVVTKALHDAERQLAEGRTGLEGLVGNASSLDTLQTLNDLLAATSGHQRDQLPGQAAVFLEQLADKALPWRALCKGPSQSLSDSAAALHASQGNLLLTQASLKKTIRAIEKQQYKFRKQAQDWSEYHSVQAYTAEAHRAGLAGVKGQLDLIRALREVHTQEVRQELAQYEADSMEAEALEAAKARAGEGLLKKVSAEHVTTIGLEMAIEHLMKKCESLRARKRFFANKVVETNTSGTPPTGSIPATGSTPPAGTIPLQSPAVEVQMPPLSPQAATSPGLASGTDFMLGPSQTPAVQMEVDSLHLMPAADHPQQVQPRQNADAETAQHGNFQTAVPPQQARHDQQETADDLPRLHDISAAQLQITAPQIGQAGTAPAMWEAGVRAESGMALAIGPWAHTSSCLPVSTQSTATVDLTHHTTGSAPGNLAPPQIPSEPAIAEPESIVGDSHTAAEPCIAAATGQQHTQQDAVDQQSQISSAGDSAMASPSPSTDLSAPATAAVATPDAVEDVSASISGSQVCNVCLCPIRQLIIVLQPCGHFYCEKCTAAIRAAANARCPECRSRISSTFRVPLSSAQSERSHEDLQYAKVKVVGNWMSKIEGLLRRILRLNQIAPQEKSLVFSQYTDALKLVGKALTVNNIGWVELKGGAKASSAIRDFEVKESVKVFLLPHKVGASGLTLNRANHVFLLEPSLDPAILQQAVGRAHRLGQTRPVHVTRLIMHSTVEEAVMQAQERRQPLLALTGPGEGAQLGLAGQQVAKQEFVGQEDLQHLLDAVLPNTAPVT